MRWQIARILAFTAVIWTLSKCVSRHSVDHVVDDAADEFDFLDDELLQAPHPSVGHCTDAQCSAEADALPPVASVVDRGLLQQRPLVRDILSHHFRFATGNAKLQRAFPNEVLGYVTPWNSRGYDHAKLFAHKLDYVAPVWLQIRDDEASKTPVITGQHDIDMGWIRDVREHAKAATKGLPERIPAIVPRVVYERNRLNPQDSSLIARVLIELAEKHQFDGYVVEIPVIPITVDFLAHIGKALHKSKRKLIVVLTRSGNKGEFPVAAELMNKLLPAVDRFSMNAYDYQAPGPNAPLPWITRTLERMPNRVKRKMLMGLPFYGYDNQDAIVGSTYIQTLDHVESDRLNWDTNAHECFHTYYKDTQQRTVFYPCLQFLADRLEAFQKHGVGTVIWELGQGLDYFFDLL